MVETPPTDVVTRCESADGRELYISAPVLGTRVERPEGTYEVVDRIDISEQDQADALGEAFDDA
jgi:hypothetical protein